jgi:hypothetical protein
MTAVIRSVSEPAPTDPVEAGPPEQAATVVAMNAAAPVAPL